MSKLHSINRVDGLYVVKEAGGYSCLGFANAAATARQAAEITGEAYDYVAIEAGTESGFAEYERACDAGWAAHARTGKRAVGGLNPSLIGFEGRRVEVKHADGRTERFQVGKSTGWAPCHLALARRNCLGGLPVSATPFASVRAVR